MTRRLWAPTRRLRRPGSSALIYGVDGSPDIKALIAEGKVTGSGAQSPISIGKTIAELYYKWLAGEEIEERYPIETFHDQRG